SEEKPADSMPPRRRATRTCSSSSLSSALRQSNLGTPTRHSLLDSSPNRSRLQACAAVAHTGLELRDQALSLAHLGWRRLRGAPVVLVGRPLAFRPSLL